MAKVCIVFMRLRWQGYSCSDCVLILVLLHMIPHRCKDGDALETRCEPPWHQRRTGVLEESKNFRLTAVVIICTILSFMTMLKRI